MNKINCMAVIPSIEGLYLLRRLLPTIDLPRNRIIIVDQGSQDGTEEYCKDKGYQVLQLKQRATFTKAVNDGVKSALSQGADYVLIVNNDTEFKTDIAHQLLECFKRENNLSMVAPRQIIVDQEKEVVSIRRVYWDLSTMTFSHDLENPGVSSSIDSIGFLESDFCEFTCVMIPRSVFDDIGFLDERYEFYHEDADFGYRCWLKGYRCGYDQNAIIRHFQSSTVSKQKSFSKDKLIARNKRLFANDYLNGKIHLPNLSSAEISSWSVTNANLYLFLNKYGLISSSPDCKTLSTLAHPEMVNTDYLLTVWETTKLPKKWLNHLYKFKHIFVPSKWNADVFKEEGFLNVSVIPFGVNTDIFNVTGEKFSFPWGKSILCICRSQYRKALDVTERMWLAISSKLPGTYLVLYGKDTSFNCLDDMSFRSKVFGKFIAKIYDDLKIVHLIPAVGDYVSDDQVAKLYRSVDLYLLNSRSEGFGYSVVEAMACGVLSIVPNYGSTQEFIRANNCLPLRGIPIQANYSDKGFGDVGFWWEPDFDDLCEKVILAISMPETERLKMVKNAHSMVLNQYTWRHAAHEMRMFLNNQNQCAESFTKNLLKDKLAEVELDVNKEFEVKLLEMLVKQQDELIKYAKDLSLSTKNTIENTLLFKVSDSNQEVAINVVSLMELENSSFLEKAYFHILGRASDLHGRDHYLKRLNSGVSKLQVLYEIVNSKEAEGKSHTIHGLDIFLENYKSSKGGLKKFFN